MNIKSFIIISLSLTANIFASQELHDNILYKWKNNQFVQNEEKCSVDTITLVPTYKNFKYNRDLILSNAASAEADKEHSHILHLRIDDDIEGIKEEILEKLIVLENKVENEEDEEIIKKTMEKIDAIKESDKGYLIIGDDE